jgi:hypothetical protein
LENENSNKLVQFTLEDVDSAYDYVTVYYTRQTSSGDHTPITESYKLNRKYKIKGSVCLITIDGFEERAAVSLEQINLKYFIANRAKTQAVCANRLFLGNLDNPKVNHEDLTDLSLRMLPYYKANVASGLIGELDHNYNDIGNSKQGFEYYNVKNIYDKVGYWNEEIYRLGVVYIMNDDSLSPVYNIRGVDKVPEINSLADYSYEPFWTDDNRRNYLSYDETTYSISSKSSLNLENAKGVIRI